MRCNEVALRFQIYAVLLSHWLCVGGAAVAVNLTVINNGTINKLPFGCFNTLLERAIMSPVKVTA